MDRLLQDIRFGLRLLWRDRGFALTTLLTLAVCIGANTTIFAVVNAVLLRPLPVPEPGQLVHIYNSYPRAGIERSTNGVPDYYDRLRDVDVFEELALYNTRGVTIGIEGDPQRLTGMIARPSLLRMLRVQPIRGRIFSEDEGEEGHTGRVVLTYDLWQQLYAGRDSAVGEDLRIDGNPHTIVGVLPKGFYFVDPDVKLWMSVAFSADEKSDDSRHSNDWSMVGRLKAGRTVVQAQQQLDALNARNMERFPHFKEILTNAGFYTVATSLQDELVRNVRGTLFLLWGGVLFVLLIGVVNITNLVLVRSSTRMKELATRHALGASLGTLTRQLTTETVLLTIVGGVLGLLVGYCGLAMLTTLGANMPRGTEIRMDAAVVAFTLALALAVGVLVSLVPVFNLRQANLSQAFREETRSGTSGRATRLLRRGLVASQVAFAFMLLIGAGLLLASFQRVLAIEPGFEPRGVLTARIALPSSRYAGAPELRTFADRLLEGARSVPFVRHAGLTSSIPFGDDYSDSVIIAEGYQMAPGESLISPHRIGASDGYFEAMEIDARAGRLYSASDSATAPAVVIVDERLARKFWGSANPVGRRMFQPDNIKDLTKPGPNARWYTVVGVVAEVRISGLVAREDRIGAYYFPLAQQPARNLVLTVKTAADPTTLVTAIRHQLGLIDPELPLYSVRTMQERMDSSLVDRRTPMMLALLFSAIALLLAAIGIYGVLAYQVSQRTREIGIRMALGSDRSGIFRLVLGEGIVLLAVGLALGVGGAFAIRRAIETQLYGVGGMDPIVLLSVGVVLGLVALVACIVPARRASKIEPILALAER
jgi:putative ABC transport system permease protein